MKAIMVCAAGIAGAIVVLGLWVWWQAHFCVSRIFDSLER